MDKEYIDKEALSALIGLIKLELQKYPPSMHAIDQNRIKVYEEHGGYYFSENNWKAFIGDVASDKFGCNRVYVERSQDRGTYGMYALSYNADPIYNAWYSKSEWSERFAKEHPGESFREPYDNEYPLLDSIVQRNRDGSVIVRLLPLDDREAVSLYYLKMVTKSLEEKISEVQSNYGDMLNEVYAGTEGLAYELSADGKHYICTGLGDIPENSDIEIAGYYEGLPVTEIGGNAFNGKALASVRIPTTINRFGYNAFGWSGAVGVVYVKDLAKWATASFESSSTPVTANPTPPKVYIKGRYTTDLVIPEGVTYISRRAFMHWKQFKTLTLPDTVWLLDEMSFQYCQGLESVIIPASVERVEGSAFGLCSSLRSVTFEGKPKILSQTAFERDTSLTDIYVPWKEGEVAGAPWGATNAAVHYQEVPLTIVGLLPYHPPTIITNLGYRDTLPESSDVMTYGLDYSQIDSSLRIEGKSLQIITSDTDWYGTGICENVTIHLISETETFDGSFHREYEVVITGKPAKLAIVCVD